MAQQIQLRNGTAAQWTSANPTLAVGELGVETDTNKFKVGTGSTAWNSLAYSVGFTWRGAWSSATAYAVNDLVTYGNASYISIQAGTNQTPGVATSYWTVVVSGSGLAIGGTNTQVQYNNAGLLGGSANLTFDGTILSAGAVKSIVAATQDSVILQGRAGGTSSYGVTLTPTTLAANRTLTLPDASGTILQSGTAVTVAQGGTGRAVGNYSIYANEIHVGKDGNDTTGDGTLINPVLTITKALTLVGAGRNTVIVHPGSYSESPTVSSANTTIATSELTGANTLVSGTLTLSAAARVSGLKMTNLTITGTGSTYISNCTVDTQVVKSGSNYVEIINSELQCTAGVQITGAGAVSIVGNKCWAVAVSNASANVLIKDSYQVITPSVTAGTLNIDGSAIFAATPASNAVTSSAGSFITLANSFVLNSAGTSVERVSLAGYYSILNLVYDKTNSTFAGTSLNAIDYFQYINADNLLLANTGSVQFADADSSNYIAFKAPSVVGSNVTYTLPAGVPSVNGQALTSTTAGVMSWSTVSSPAATPTVLGTVYGSMTSGSPYLTALGSGAGTSTTGVQNVVVGYGALNSNTTGAYSTAIGYQALAVSTGGQNTAVGRMAMVTATTASGNTALGVNAMYSATSAGSNVAVGDTAAQNLTTGSGNIAIGSGALNNGGGISNTVAIGTQAMLNANSGTFNLAIGYRALYAQDSYGGESNTAIGYQAFLNLKGGAGGIAQANTAVGSNAGANLTGQGNNSSTFIGAYAGYSATSGAGNTFIGSNSGYNVTSGSKNTVIGTYNGNQGSLDIRTASNYIVFSDGDGNPRGMFNGSGYFAASPSGGFPDGTNLGFHYFSSPVSAGGSGDKVVYIRADSASFAGTAFSVRGNRNTTNSTFNTFDTRNGNDTGAFIIRDSGNAINTNNSYGSTSDVVLKENIVDATPKLAALNQVKIRSYNLKAKPDEKHIGVIAQELETVFPGLVETDNEGIKNVKYSVFVPMLIKAVQELSAEVASLKSQLNRV